MEPTATGQSRRRRLSGLAMVVIVLILGCLATIGATVTVRHGQQSLATEAMDHDITDISEVISDAVGHYGDALTDLAAGISSQDVLTRTDFNAMTASLDRHRLPGATGVSWAVPAYDPQVAALQALWRARGASGLTLYRTGTDTLHKFVIFAHSFTGEPTSSGRDLSTLPMDDDTLRIAGETGAFTLGRAHVLLRDRNRPADQRQMSFVLTAPVFGRPGTAGARTVHGWVITGVRGTDFLSQTLHQQAQGALQMKLTDPASGTVIAAVTGGTPMPDASLERHTDILVGQHIWRLSIRPTTRLLSSADRRITVVTLLDGAVVTLLLATLVGVLASGRARAMDRVDEATAALRQDITRREALELELHRLAFHDQLTGLANRNLFYDRVGQALRSHTREAASFAVFFIDLDGFKQVNDELGHSAGDVVLREIAERLRGCLRDSDTVARFGGDEFAVIVERLATADDVHITAGRIVEAVQRPIDAGRREVTVTASVGIALNRDGDAADDILREADMAMYTAKTTGKCRHVLAGAG